MIVQRFTVTRADGFTFRTVVYLPSNYQDGTRLPGFFWFYPREFTSQEQYDGGGAGGGAGQAARRPTSRTSARCRSSSSCGSATPSSRTTRRSSAPTGQMNNNYVNDLRNNLAATIDELDRARS